MSPSLEGVALCRSNLCVDRVHVLKLRQAGWSWANTALGAALVGWLGRGPHNHCVSLSPTLFSLVPPLFVIQKLFSQPSVLLQKELYSKCIFRMWEELRSESSYAPILNLSL